MGKQGGSIIYYFSNIEACFFRRLAGRGGCFGEKTKANPALTGLNKDYFVSVTLFYFFRWASAFLTIWITI
jgi:hypothetical protein